MSKKDTLLKVASYKELKDEDIQKGEYPFYASLHEKKGFFNPKLVQTSLLGYHTDKDFNNYWADGGKKYDYALKIKNTVYKKSKKVDKN